MSDVTTYELDQAMHYEHAVAGGELQSFDFPAGTYTPADDDEAAVLVHLHATGQVRLQGEPAADAPAPAPKRASKRAATQED